MLYKYKGREKQYNREWDKKNYQKNKEKIKKRKRDWYKNNSEKAKQRSRKYRQEHKDKVKEGWQKWYKKNYKEYTQKNKERILKNAANFREKHREQRRYENKLYCKNNPEKIRESRRRHYLNGGKEYIKEYLKTEKGKMARKKVGRKHNLKNKGLTLEQYDQIFESQNGVCAICGKPETKKHQSGNIRRLCVDHSHKTSKVRGLLCNKCNLVIGNSNDSVEVLASAIKYLTKHQP